MRNTLKPTHANQLTPPRPPRAMRRATPRPPVLGKKAVLPKVKNLNTTPPDTTPPPPIDMAALMANNMHNIGG